MKKQDWIKARTLELYDMLPQTTLAERNKFTDIRDEIIQLNYSFFGYIAKNQYVTDPMATYEDKLQVALIAFCQMWSKYKFAPEYSEDLEYREDTMYMPEDYVFHEGTLYRCKSEDPVSGIWDPKVWVTVKRYRTDLSFSVFFKPRLSECVRRELNMVKYSLRREICMKAAAQLGKHWGQVTKEDIPKVKLPPDEMAALVAIFCTQYDNPYGDDVSGASVIKTASAQAGETSSYWLDNIYNEEYDEIEDLIIHEMIEQESKLDDAYLLKMSQMYCIPFADLKKAQPIGEAKLKRKLEETLYIKDSFEAETSFGDDSDIEN